MLPSVFALPNPKRPTHVPQEEAWYWSDRWQAEEREVSEQLARREYEAFNSLEDVLTFLHHQV